MSDVLAGLRDLVPGAVVVEHAPKRLYVSIPCERLDEVARYLHLERGMRLAICTGLDTREGYEVLYHFSDDPTGIVYTLKVLAPKDRPAIPSLATWFPAASWIEREMRELIGVEFDGHPDMRPLLTSDTDWESDRRPLRRDYERRGEQHER